MNAVNAEAKLADTIEPSMLPDDWPGAVLLYWDGKYAAPFEQVRRFRRVARITVTGDPAAARFAREVDVERYDAGPAQAPGYVDARRALGHDDATVYFNRENAAAVMQALDGRGPRLHIATLDDYPWTPATLAANLAAEFGVVVDPELIWAIQNKKADPGLGIYWDTSDVFGKQDWWDPQSH